MISSRDFTGSSCSMVTVVVTGHSSRRSTPPRWTPTGNGLQRGQSCWPPLGRTVGRQRAATWPPPGRISWPPTGAHQLRLSRLHLPGSPGPWPTRLLRELLTSHEPQREEGDRQTDQGLAPQPSQRNGPRRTRRGHQRPGPRLVQLLRSLLPLRVVCHRSAHRRTPRSMGDAEVQTIARPTHQSMEMARRCPSARATTLRSLAPPRFNPTPDCGSRMTGDCHVRF